MQGEITRLIELTNINIAYIHTRLKIMLAKRVQYRNIVINRKINTISG